MSSIKNTKPILLGVLILLALVMAAMAALIATSGPRGPVAFFARTINDASYDCEEKIDQHFKADLLNKSYDPLSSRYEPNNRQYQIYYRVDFREHIDDYFINSERLVKCVVWEWLGYVSDFQVLKL